MAGNSYAASAYAVCKGVGVVEAVSAPLGAPNRLYSFSAAAEKIEGVIVRALRLGSNHLLTGPEAMKQLRDNGLRVTPGPKIDQLAFVLADETDPSSSMPHYVQLNVDLTLDEVANGVLESMLCRVVDRAISSGAERLVASQRAILSKARSVARACVDRAKGAVPQLFWAGFVPGLGAGPKAGRKLHGYLTLVAMIVLTETKKLSVGGTSKNRYLCLPKNRLSRIRALVLTPQDQNILTTLAAHRRDVVDTFVTFLVGGIGPLSMGQGDALSPTVQAFVESAFKPEGPSPLCDRFPKMKHPLPVHPGSPLLVFEARRLPDMPLADLAQLAVRLRFRPTCSD
jgi:hypothetical protein